MIRKHKFASVVSELMQGLANGTIELPQHRFSLKENRIEGLSPARHREIARAGVSVWNHWRQHNSGIRADLHGLDLRDIDLRGADLENADLREANLANMDLRASNLHYADLRNANLSGTKLMTACLRNANLIGAVLTGADFSEAEMAGTILGDSDMSEVKGLDTVRHLAPSWISIDAIYNSKGKIPDIFLRKLGIPESFIATSKQLVANQSVDFYSCFISYSARDQAFAERLRDDLQEKGVRCWFAPEDLRIGASLRVSFDDAIRMHDKLMVLLSENSVKSEWVEKEVETALVREREQNRIVLFPIRLDDAVMETDQAWATHIRRTRSIGDFRNWKNHDSYKQAFDRLLRDLKAEDKAQSAAAQ
jgi:hypothetical protein